ncbi:unnamed protein product [Arabidopsis thaliana]|uniref:Uncharacterized protein n=3 Tax=Arabidopsis TaxID=3701 RepID=B3H7A1_ARATH|nr:uncharacterized protein AT3G49796 [Arabidopsis thaliana]AEE78591.1 hypothetical protein AT3G49796 [Arabidopsis thaliana]KAG7633850.1 hypothetical protein ISN44_As03g041230 [Arabidopsis suecica]VYS59899.1 unnamed protein product [Arabidopsis thaliana]|eukprot:NP_001118804.1 hypothetical protein AT3G49796 [Arabidopsis thaliana]
MDNGGGYFLTNERKTKQKIRFEHEIGARHVDGEVLTPWKRRAVAYLVSQIFHFSPPIESSIPRGNTWQLLLFFRAPPISSY